MAHQRESLGPTIHARNFGPIDSATIDLRPLTVFIGPSNAGKSYLAVLIYALHRHFGNGFLPGRLAPLIGASSLDASSLGEAPEGAFPALREIAAAVLAAGDDGTQSRKVPVPAPHLSDIVCDFLDSQRSRESHELVRCFGVAAPALIRRGSKSAHFGFSTSDPRAPLQLEHRVSIGSRSSKLDVDTSLTAPDALHLELQGRRDPITRVAELLHHAEADEDLPSRSFAARFRHLLLRRVVRPALGPLNYPAYYLPASRTGIMHAHSVVVSALIGSAPMAGLRESTPTPAFSGVLADFLEQLLQPEALHSEEARHRARGSGKRDFARELETRILGGSIDVERAELTGYPSFTYRPRGTRSPLPLTASSSMVSELAPVVHYLRQFAAPGDMLIVEEPESHLHPAMQVAFVRFLSELVVDGVRVLLTTHSEWVLEELANIVERSKVPAQHPEASDRVALGEDQVGAWLFEPGPDGSAVKRIDVNESGLYPCGFREVGKQLEEDWEATSLRIAEARLADPKTSEEPWDEARRALLSPD